MLFSYQYIFMVVS